MHNSCGSPFLDASSTWTACSHLCHSFRHVSRKKAAVSLSRGCGEATACIGNRDLRWSGIPKGQEEVDQTNRGGKNAPAEGKTRKPLSVLKRKPRAPSANHYSPHLECRPLATRPTRATLPRVFLINQPEMQQASNTFKGPQMPGALSFFLSLWSCF